MQEFKFSKQVELSSHVIGSLSVLRSIPIGADYSETISMSPVGAFIYGSYARNTALQSVLGIKSNLLPEPSDVDLIVCNRSGLHQHDRQSRALS